MAMQQPTDTRETADLIGSDKVEGTEVYRSNGDYIGEIDRVMIEKRRAVRCKSRGTTEPGSTPLPVAPVPILVLAELRRSPELLLGDVHLVAGISDYYGTAPYWM
jgi:hypothetical protein